VTPIILEIVFILVLILANAVFATAEMALLSARRPRLQRMAARGDRRAAKALEFTEHPDQFLSTIQVGITLVGILAGAFGGATLAEQLDDYLEHIPALARYSETIAVAVVVLAITYLSLVLGELVPKRIALTAPERFAIRTTGLVSFLSRLGKPAVWLLTRSTSFVVRLIGIRGTGEPTITEDDLRALLSQASAVGTIARTEQVMVERVFRLADRPVESIMNPRAEIDWLNLDRPLEELRALVRGSRHARIPVGQAHLDNLYGFVNAKDLWAMGVESSEDLKSRISQPLYVPDSMRASRLLERFRETRNHFAMVLDEHGAVEGIVTLTDVLEALVGELPGAGEHRTETAVQREDGSWLFDASIDIEEAKMFLDAPVMVGQKRHGYQTLAGYVIDQIGRLPRTGDCFDKGDLRFEIVDMDGRRVDKILVSPRR
jgi:magnesium and cobalt exporter, CNNM family